MPMSLRAGDRRDDTGALGCSSWRLLEEALRRVSTLVLLSALLVFAAPGIANAADNDAPILTSFSRTSPNSISVGESYSVSYAASDSSGVRSIHFGFFDSLGGPRTLIAHSSSGVASATVGADWPNGTYRLEHIDIYDQSTGHHNSVWWRNGRVDKHPSGLTGPSTHSFDLAAADFVVGTTAAPPSVRIDSGPSGPTNDDTPSFHFSGTEGVTFSCSVDSGTPDFQACSGINSHTAAALPDGTYVFRLVATDANGNTAVAERGFAVDTTPPLLRIDSGPSGQTAHNRPTFSFSGDDDATFSCSIDQGTPSFGNCSGANLHTASTELVDGGYVFRVQATDALGNAAIAERAFTVDTAPPVVRIDSGPSALTNDNTPTFNFSGSSGATFSCSISQGGSRLGPCSELRSHTAAAELADGSYIFRVRATKATGVWAEAERRFELDTTPPDTVFTSPPKRRTTPKKSIFVFASSPSTATLECSLDGADYVACTSPQKYKGLARGVHTFRARAVDPTGNYDASAATWTWTVR